MVTVTVVTAGIVDVTPCARGMLDHGCRIQLRVDVSTGAAPGAEGTA